VDQKYNRRTFLNRVAIPTMLAPFGLLARANGRTTRSETVQASDTTPIEPHRPAPFSEELVSEFVGVCHRDIEQVSKLLVDEPKLVYASQDRGGGDWETGLDGASHVGRRDIARLLLTHGARKDIFGAAMLGEREVIAAMVNADSTMSEQVGPHGYRVLYHVAISGDVEMAEVVLSEVGDKNHHVNQALSAAVRDGHYDMTRWLLAQGATSVNASGFGGKPLDIAIRRGDTRIAGLLREHGATEGD
jgi:ankyrin repeat protein